MFEMWSSMIGPRNIFSASRIAIEVKVNAAGLTMMPRAGASIASCTHSTISYSRFD